MNTLHVAIEPLILSKIMFWVRRAGALEVSGFGKVVRRYNSLKVVDAILLPQKNTFAHTEINADDVGRAMFQLKDTPGEMNFWWHSHGHGATFFSGTDTDTIQQLGLNGYVVASVFNTKGSVQSSLFCADPFPHFVDNLQLLHHSEAAEALSQEWAADYDGKVTRDTVRERSYRHNNRRGTRHTSETSQYWDYKRGCWVGLPSPMGRDGVSTASKSGADNLSLRGVSNDQKESLREVPRVFVGKPTYILRKDSKGLNLVAAPSNGQSGAGSVPNGDTL